MNKRFLSKFFAVLLSITLALSIAGCNKTAPNTNENRTEVSQNTQDEASEEQTASGDTSSENSGTESSTDNSQTSETEDNTTTEDTPSSSEPDKTPEVTPPSTDKDDTPSSETTPSVPTQPSTPDTPSSSETPSTPESTPSTPSTPTPPQSGSLTFTDHSYDDILRYTAPITAEEITGVRNVLTSIISTSMSDVEKIKAAHDWLVKNTTYENTYYNRENSSNFVYNLIYNKVAVCQGYTVTFYVMMTELNIPCTIIGGQGATSTGSEAHAWNAVKLDGYWYYVDVTWDDPVLNGSSNYPDGANISYQYLLCTYATISKNHFEEANEYAPTAPTPNGTSNSYNEKMYELSGISKIFHMNSMDEVDVIASQITSAGKYVIFLDNSSLVASDVINAIFEKLNRTMSASMSESCITLDIS